MELALILIGIALVIRIVVGLVTKPEDGQMGDHRS